MSEDDVSEMFRSDALRVSTKPVWRKYMNTKILFKSGNLQKIKREQNEVKLRNMYRFGDSGGGGSGSSGSSGGGRWR